MSAPIQIDPRAAVRTQAPVDELAPPIAQLGWLCTFCGKLHVFEGGRPFGLGRQDDCEKCGCRLASAPDGRAAAKSAAGPVISIGKYWF